MKNGLRAVLLLLALLTTGRVVVTDGGVSPHEKACRCRSGAQSPHNDDRAVHVLSAPLEERELVKEALAVGRQLVSGPRWSRVLKVVGLHDVARARARLQDVRSDAGVRLREVLGLEEQAVRHLVGAHPASSLLETGQRRFSPGWCVAISNMSHDAEAVVTGIREMERRGVRTLLLNIGSEAS